MKRIVTIRALLVAGVLVAAAPAGALAQVLTGAEAKIPFDFVVEGKILKAGAYRFEKATAFNVIKIAELTGSETLLTSTIRVGNPYEPPKPRIVFLKQGATYTLSQVWMASGGAGYAVKTPKPGPEHVQVAINLAR